MIGKEYLTHRDMIGFKELADEEFKANGLSRKYNSMIKLIESIEKEHYVRIKPNEIILDILLQGDDIAINIFLYQPENPMYDMIAKSIEKSLSNKNTVRDLVARVNEWLVDFDRSLTIA